MTSRSDGPFSEKWKSAVAYMEVRDYQKALDKVEGLVVQRLFELTKMGLASTGKETCEQLIGSVSHLRFIGYKMCLHINKALKTRCEIIQMALKKFNAAARTLR
jgi:hypothetical protein